MGDHDEYGETSDFVLAMTWAECCPIHLLACTKMGSWRWWRYEPKSSHSYDRIKRMQRGTGGIVADS